MEATMVTPEELGDRIEEVIRRLAGQLDIPLPDRLMTLAHVAEVLDVSVDFVRTIIRRGELVAHDITPDGLRRNYRVRQSDLHAYIAAITEQERDA